MKTTFKYIGSMILTLALGACNLDQYPYSEIAADEYVTDASAVNNLVIGTYNGLHDVMYYEWAMTELRSDNTRMRANNSTSSDTKLIEQLDQNVITTAHTWVEDYWNAVYAAIDRANKVISYLDVVEDPTQRAQYEGEAKFLRAHLYFNLVRLWGPVFLVTKKTGADEARYMQRSPVEDIYALIEGDLNAIIDGNMLPEQSASGDEGRATMPAVKGLLAKVYMTRYEVGSEQYMKAGRSGSLRPDLRHGQRDEQGDHLCRSLPLGQRRPGLPVRDALRPDEQRQQRDHGFAQTLQLSVG